MQYGTNARQLGRVGAMLAALADRSRHHRLSL
jgi:hypothetical protein